MYRLLRGFGISIGVTLAVMSYILLSQGAAAGFVTLILAAIELAFSFDNAVINAQVLNRLSPLWRTLFLTVGIVIAIFLVRAFLPILIVSLTAHLPLGVVTNLALHYPTAYAEKLVSARPGITAFGGAFLLALSLSFFMQDREIRWLEYIERPLGKLEQWWLPLLAALAVVVVLPLLPGVPHRNVSLTAGLAGLAAYAAINGAVALLNNWFSNESDRPEQQVGWAAFATFMYLELLDASLSFDGAIGAFAITNSVILIAAGLGIGAIWVRSLTVYMVRNKTLEAYRYLEHGAHYAIFVLAATMLLAVLVDVPDFVTGTLCLGLIAAALITSRQALEAHAR